MATEMKRQLILNTSNAGKLQEFERLFAQYGITITVQRRDLHEIDADPVTIVVHKASQLQEDVLVEDTSLEIEGTLVGTNIRWVLNDMPHYVGRKAKWRTLLAYREGDLVHVFEGQIEGTIVQPRGEEGFGFDPFFLPNNSSLTLAEAKSDAVNARAKAVEAFVHAQHHSVVHSISQWNGPWQETTSSD
jgi:XTP/dITP diphosphohydrolase